MPLVLASSTSLLEELYLTLVSPIVANVWLLATVSTSTKISISTNNDFYSSQSTNSGGDNVNLSNSQLPRSTSDAKEINVSRSTSNNLLETGAMSNVQTLNIQPSNQCPISTPHQPQLASLLPEPLFQNNWGSWHCSKFTNGGKCDLCKHMVKRDLI